MQGGRDLQMRHGVEAWPLALSFSPLLPLLLEFHSCLCESLSAVSEETSVSAAGMTLPHGLCYAMMGHFIRLLTAS